MVYLLISFLIFFGYVAYIISKHGFLNSISESVFRTHNELLFLIFTVGTAMPIIFTSKYILMQVAGVLLTYVGVAPNFKDKIGIGGKNGIEDEIHVVGASGAVVFAMVSMVLNYKLWYIPIPLILTFILFKFIRANNKTFWVEIVAFASIFAGLMIDKF